MSIVSTELATWRIIEAPTRNVPKFPVDQLPEKMQTIAESFSNTQRVPLHYVVASMISSVSLACTGRVYVPVSNQHGQPVQLYTAMIGESGTRKTSAITEFSKPLNKMLTEEQQQRERENAQNKMLKEDLETQLQVLRKKRQKDFDNEALTTQINLYAQRIGEVGSSTSIPSIWSDVTPEAVGQELVSNDGIALIQSDEGSIVNMLTSKAGMQKGALANLDVFLQGYDSQAVNILRVTSGRSRIPCASIGISFGLQPRVAERFCRDPEVVGRGLAARFMFFMGDDTIRFETDENNERIRSTDFPPELKADWYNMLTCLIKRLGYNAHGHDGVANFVQLPLTPVARRVYNKLADECTRLECDVYQGDKAESMRVWIRKAADMGLRLSAVLALMQSPTCTSIDADSLLKAKRIILEYIVPCAELCFIPPTKVLSGLQEILWKRIAKEPEMKMSKRDLYQVIRGQKDFKGELGRVKFEQTLDEMTKNGYLQTIAKGGRGQPSLIVYANPNCKPE